MRNSIVFYLNGIKKVVGANEAKMMLSDYLRYDQCLTGTKVVCAEGDCGACSVLKFFPHSNSHPDEKHHFIPVNSCISPVAIMDGSSLITVDALKKEDGTLHETQRAMMENHGSQCGFCTPGFVMALAGLTEKKIEQKENSISEEEAKNATTGNLCRCTGYQAIIDAAKNINFDECEHLFTRFFNPEQEKTLADAYKESVLIENQDYRFFAPKTIKEATDFFAAHPDTKIIASSTDLGVVHNKRRDKLMNLISLHLIEELYAIENKKDEISFGARVNFSDFRNAIKNDIPEFAHYIDVFASPQIKNLATLIGNVCTASPIGDTPPALLALEADITMVSSKGTRTIPLSEFFLDYRKTDKKADELVTKISFKKLNSNSTLKLYKNANRKDLDISAINLGVKVDWKDKKAGLIEKAVIAVGGVAATTIRLKETEKLLAGQKISTTLLEQAGKKLHEEFNPLSDLRASSAYRHIVVENLFRRSFYEANGEALA